MGPQPGEPRTAARGDHGPAVGREIRALLHALLVCCSAALVLGAIGAAVVAMSGGAGSVLAPLLTFVALGQLAAVVSGGAALVGSGRLVRGSRGVGAPAGAAETSAVEGAGAQRSPLREGARRARLNGSGGGPPGVALSVGQTFQIVARGLLAACVLFATVWVLAQPDAAAGALTGALLAGQVAAVLLAAGGRLSAGTAQAA